MRVNYMLMSIMIFACPMSVMSIQNGETLCVGQDKNVMEKHIMKNNETIAFVNYCIDPDEKTININWMRTNPEWRKKGLAQFLVESILQEAKQCLFGSVKVSVDEDYKTACRVFERCGFKMVRWNPYGKSGEKTMLYYENSQ